MSWPHWLYPEWAWAVLPTGLLLLNLIRRQRSTQTWDGVIDPALQAHVLITSKNRCFIPLSLLTLAWITSIIALCGPSWTQQMVPLMQRLPARVIILDMSPAMRAADVKPNRLQRAKYKIIDLLSMLPAGETGLVAFSQAPYVVSPLTQDKQTIQTLLPELNTDIMPGNGFNLAWALKKSAALLQQAGYRNGNLIVIAHRASPAAIKVADTLKNQGFHLSVLGVGTQTGAPIPLKEGGFVKQKNGTMFISRLNQNLLKQIASPTYYQTLSSNSDDLHHLLAHTQEKMISKKRSLSIWKNEGYWFALFALLLASLTFRRGWFCYV
ncbi:MAG: hypothetical protein DHS20C10_02890 [marine bacterium B5-7]|nr:MAG: hypothetical protein DHS20C10_02890 [marine bacterium B5-7]